MNRLGLFVKKNAPTILSFTAIAGCIGTAIISAVTTSKIEQNIESNRKTKFETVYFDNEPKDIAFKESRPETKELIKKYWYCYLPTAGVCALTCACIGLSDSMNRKRQAALLGACAIISETFREYKEIVGREEDARIEAEIARRHFTDDIEMPEGDELLFYEPITGNYFNSTMEALKDAENKFQRNYIIRGYAEFGEFLEFIGLERTPETDMLGWSTWAEGSYGYRWVDIEHDRTVMFDGLECYILHYPFAPHADYLED